MIGWFQSLFPEKTKFQFWNHLIHGHRHRHVHRHVQTPDRPDRNTEIPYYMENEASYIFMKILKFQLFLGINSGVNEPEKRI